MIICSMVKIYESSQVKKQLSLYKYVRQLKCATMKIMRLLACFWNARMWTIYYCNIIFSLKNLICMVLTNFICLSMLNLSLIMYIKLVALKKVIILHIFQIPCFIGRKKCVSTRSMFDSSLFTRISKILFGFNRKSCRVGN